MNKITDKSKVLKSLALFLIIIILILLSLIGKMIFKDIKEYKEVEDTQQKIIDDVVTKDDNDTVFSIDWNRLKAINEDIAWIRIPDTTISYPIVQSDSNTQYLRMNIYGEYSRGGTPFVDSNIENPFSCPNTIIYGHNLMNGAMFSQLKKYSDSEFANKHQVVEIYLPTDEKREYKVVAFHIVQATDRNIYNPYVDKIEDYKKYMLQGNKVNNEDTELFESDKIITLSTCTNNGDSRYVLHAVSK